MGTKCSHYNDIGTCETCYAELREAHDKLLRVVIPLVQEECWGQQLPGPELQDAMLEAGVLRRRTLEEIRKCVGDNMTGDSYCECMEYHGDADDIRECYTFAGRAEELFRGV